MLDFIINTKPNKPAFYATYTADGPLGPVMRTGYGKTHLECAADAMERWLMWVHGLDDCDREEITDDNAD